MEIGILALGFLIFFAAGMPAAFALGLICVLVVLITGDISIGLVASKMTDTINQWTWLAIPLYILMGNMLNSTGITERLIKFSQNLVGHISGGLSHVSVLTNTIMAGMSGSAVADCSATGSILIPAMIKEGYSSGYSASIIAASCLIGPLIPPSIGFIMFGSLTGASVLRLFLAGAIPGLLLSLSLIITGYILSKRRGYAQHKRASFKKMARGFWSSLPVLMIPILIMGGMRAGQFTVTEAAAVAIFYSLVVGLILSKGLEIGPMKEAILSSVKSSSAVMFVVAAGGVFSVILNVYQIGPAIFELFQFISRNPVSFLLLSCLFLLLLGCCMEVSAIIIIFVPLFAPIAAAYDINLVHYGVIFIFVVNVGLITPPYGLAMFITCDFAQCEVSRYMRDGFPLLIAILIVLLVLIFFPTLTSWLPNLVMG